MTARFKLADVGGQATSRLPVKLPGEKNYKMITKALAGTAIVFGAAVGLAAPAIADPNPFGGIGCTCQPEPANEKVGAPIPSPDQTTPALQQGLAALQANQGHQ